MGKTPATHRFSDYAVEEFTKEWMDIVKQNYNHPCIITWTAFNESWGLLLTMLIQVLLTAGEPRLKKSSLKESIVLPVQLRKYHIFRDIALRRYQMLHKKITGER